LGGDGPGSVRHPHDEAHGTDVRAADAIFAARWHVPERPEDGKLVLEASVFVFPATALCFLAFGRMYCGAMFPPAGD